MTDSTTARRPYSPTEVAPLSVASARLDRFRALFARLDIVAAAPVDVHGDADLEPV